MSIYRTAVNKPVTTALIFVAFAILGIFSLINLSINQLPEFEANNIMVMTSYNGASAEDIETNISKVLENSLNGVSNLKNITSNSKENVSVIGLEFEYGIDIDVATNDVRDKLDLVKSYLPDGAGNPIIFKFSADDLPIMIISAKATDNYYALDKLIDDKITTNIARIKGVGTVSVMGAPKREIHVYCDPNKLQAYNLTISGISSTIAAENRNMPSGSMDIGTSTYNLRIEKEFASTAELYDVVVGYNNGSAVFLRDVATIVDGVEEKAQEAFTNGTPSATIVVQKQSGANTVNICKKVKKELDVIQETLPPDVHLQLIVDGSENIINTINSLRDTILVTFLVVMLVVYVFLGRWRATIIIILSIPISLLASLIYLYASGNTLNIVSMSALSIAIGMVVDDAIVVLENVMTHLERGEKPKEAAVHATGEVGISVIASTLTMLAVFIPLTMINGMAGIMFRQLGWIVSIIMTVSTTAALTLVPMLCAYFLRVEKKSGKLYKWVFENFNKFIEKLTEAYAKSIAACLRHRTVTVIVATLIFVLTLVLLGPGIKTEFFPKSDSGRLSVQAELPVGTNQEVTAVFARQLYDRFIEEFPEIQRCSYSFGQADTDNAFGSMQSSGSHIMSFNINIGSMTKRERSVFEIADQMRADLASYPDIKKYTVSEGGGMGMGSSSKVVVEVYGYDFTITDAFAKELAAGMRQMGGCPQVSVARDDYTPEFQVDFDRTKLALNGLTSTQAASFVTAAINGSTQTYFREDGDEYKIRVRYSPEFRHNVEDVENILIYNSKGQTIRVADLGTVVEKLTPPQINRKNRERYVAVTGIVGNGYALSEVVESTQALLATMEIPQELTVIIAGDYEEQQKSFRDLIVLMILIVILVYIVMAAQFESFLSPLVIMFSIPFAVTGVILGVRITNTPIGMMAMVGLIILLGIVVKNGIVLIDYAILRRERGASIADATVDACRSRLRPILMTTLTTVLGMLPLAMGRGEGSEMWRSMGITVAWGLSVSSLITLFIIPTIYTSFSTWQMNAKARKQQRQLKRQEQE
ncbi:MAG: efflux RND transporter permease subunit [Bacteroidales bacterium]|nr:efflux RND transporter permease subunit [Bacteroidales bacterium]